MKSSNLILFGSGDFALEITEYLMEHNSYSTDKTTVITDIVSQSRDRFEDITSALGYKPFFHKRFDTVDDKDHKKALICIGSSESRHAVYKELKEANFIFHSFIHNSAWISKSAEISEGVVICPYVFIGAHSVIGANSVINVRSTIGHDVKIGKSVVISPHVNCNGKSKCGDISFIGAGVVMNPSSSIGAYSKVSSGSLIKDNFDKGFLLSGNPATGRQMFHSHESDT
jgi:sugar O-acyltransferase (sialic acid O-acetyltransferase NeuD family)